MQVGSEFRIKSTGDLVMDNPEIELAGDRRAADADPLVSLRPNHRRAHSAPARPGRRPRASARTPPGGLVPASKERLSASTTDTRTPPSGFEPPTKRPAPFAPRRCFTHRGIDHQMEEMPRGPLDAEVLLDEVRAVAVHGLHASSNRFLLALSALLQAAHFLFERRIDENVEGIGAVSASSTPSRGRRSRHCPRWPLF